MQIRKLQTEVQRAHRKCLSLIQSLDGCDNPQSLDILNMAQGREAALFAVLEYCKGDPCYLDLLK